MIIKHILVDMDPTKEEQPALTRAVSLAKHYGASLELFLVDYNAGLVANWFWNESQQEKSIQSFLRTRRRWLDSYLNQIADAGVPVSIDVRWHKPIYAAINQKAKDCKADLVIKSTHNHPKINKIFFSPNDWQLLKTCPAPLILAKSSTREQYKNIMAAIDPTESHGKPPGVDKVILDSSKSLSQALSANAHVAHCYQSLGVDVLQDVGVGVHGLETEMFEHKEYMEKLAAHHKQQFKLAIADYGFEASQQFLQCGSPQELLPEIVDKNKIDLLVMGTTYRSGLLGSTVEKILDNVNCDILAVKCQSES